MRKKLFARLREDDETLVLFTDPDEREALLQSDDDTFFITPHYEDYPMILVRLSTVDPTELAELLTESWRQRAPKRLREAFDE